MELALAPLGLRLSESGQSYKAVKAFKSMLFNTLEDLVQSPLIGEVVPYSVVLHFIFAQSPPVLKSPHQVSQSFINLSFTVPLFVLISLFFYIKSHSFHSSIYQSRDCGTSYTADRYFLKYQHFFLIPIFFKVS